MVKHVFASRQVAHVWAAQSQDTGRSGNGQFYFEGRTIYSYRSTWPLATFVPARETWLPDIVLVNEERYSHSTTARLSDVLGALRGRAVTTVACDAKQLRAYVGHGAASRC